MLHAVGVDPVRQVLADRRERLGQVQGAGEPVEAGAHHDGPIYPITRISHVLMIARHRPPTRRGQPRTLAFW